MEEFEPKKKIKIIDKVFIAKYSYVLVLAVLLIGGISFGYTFFTQNRKIASGNITTANLTINFSDRNISATNLSVPTNDSEGLSEFVKSLTITNQTAVDGRVELTLTRTSGLNLSDLRYALIVNGAIQEIDDVPTTGKILSSAIMGNEVIDVEVRLWPKTTYTGSETTFVGELIPEIKYLGPTAASTINSPAGKYVNFNGNEVWQIVKVEDGRLVLTRQADYTNATSRVNSSRYDSSLTFNDNSLITSVSTDGKNVYLAKTVKISGGTGTQADPYTIINSDFREGDKKVIAQITYKEDTETIGTQNIYYNETNYISQVIDDLDFVKWTDGTNDYELGDVTTITTDTNLTAVMSRKLLNVMKKNIDTNTTINFANNSSSTNGQGIYVLPGTESNTNPIYYYRGEINNNNVIFGDFCWQMVRTTDTGGIKMIYNGEVTGNGTTCENTTAESRQLTSTSAFNSQYNSVADVGYMKNTRYPSQSGAPTSGAYFGTSIEYGEYDTSNPGTNVYRLADDGNGSVVTILDANHHYSCDLTSATGTCVTIRYYYYVSGTDYRYIDLTNGETVEDALYKMTGNGDTTIKARNAGYVLNNTDSTAKMAIESWFRTNLTNEVDTGKRNYVSFLEDTVYCNDRSYQTTGSGAYTNSGWNPNGGDLTKYLYFGTNNRTFNGWYSDTNVPTTICPNETDRFSVSSSVAHLNYPVGLLTADEIVMAGASGSSSTSNNTYYLYTGNYYWSLSPIYFHSNGYARGFVVRSAGSLDGSNVVYTFGLRPVVSLKFGTEFLAGGDGTPTNPYVVKYE